jgi:hypothetical protein
MKKKAPFILSVVRMVVVMVVIRLIVVENLKYYV